MINLLPPDIQIEHGFKKRNSLLIKYAFIIVIIIGLALATLFAGNYLLNREKLQLEERVEQKQKDVAAALKTAGEARELATKIDTVGKLLDDEVKFSELVPAIAALIPDNARLTSLSLTTDTEIPLVLVANVDNQSTAAVMRANLEDSELFEAADLVSISPGANKTELVATIQALFREDLQL